MKQRDMEDFEDKIPEGHSKPSEAIYIVNIQHIATQRPVANLNVSLR
jgi:hypothetical protein